MPENTQDRTFADGATVTITQIASGNGRKPGQQQTLIGLGLNKIGRSRTLRMNSSFAGMIRRVAHLVDVQG